MLVRSCYQIPATVRLSTHKPTTVDKAPRPNTPRIPRIDCERSREAQIPSYGLLSGWFLRQLGNPLLLTMIATIFSNPHVCRLSPGRICHEDREPQKCQRDRKSED
jgi:hypothetical protein